MDPATSSFTASEIARASGSISRQGVAKLLAGVSPSTVRVTRGNQETPAWNFPALPASLRSRLEKDARRQRYRNAETMFAHPQAQWSPAIPLREVAESELDGAARLRGLLAPFLRDQSKSAGERNFQIAARYADTFGHVITADYARKLYQRTLARDGGVGDYGRLEIYLPENPRRKEPVAWTLADSNLADVLPALESRIASITTVNPPKAVVRSVWHVAFDEYQRLIAGQTLAERAARIVRGFLHRRAPFVSRSRDALLKAWNEKLPRWLGREGMPGALVDLRCQNGREVAPPARSAPKTGRARELSPRLSTGCCWMASPPAARGSVIWKSCSARSSAVWKTPHPCMPG